VAVKHIHIHMLRFFLTRPFWAYRRHAVKAAGMVGVEMNRLLFLLEGVFASTDAAGQAAVRQHEAAGQIAVGGHYAKSLFLSFYVACLAVGGVLDSFVALTTGTEDHNH
jgi:hypothetical protein